MSCNSGRRQLIVTLVNFSHTPFTVRRYTTVKEVRLHGERGKATVAGVVGIVATMPCHGMGITASVMSRVRAPCFGSLAPRRGLGRGGVGARAQEGSGEAELASEAKGSGEPGLTLEAKGVGRGGTRPRVLAILGVLLCSPFLYFLSL
jgi:hypothetical protein